MQYLGTVISSGTVLSDGLIGTTSTTSGGLTLQAGAVTDTVSAVVQGLGS